MITAQRAFFCSMWVCILITILSSITFTINTVGASTKNEVIRWASGELDSLKTYYILNSVFSGIELFLSLFLLVLYYKLFYAGVKRAQRNVVTLIPRKKHWHFRYSPEMTEQEKALTRLEKVYLK